VRVVRAPPPLMLPTPANRLTQTTWSSATSSGSAFARTGASGSTCSELRRTSGPSWSTCPQRWPTRSSTRPTPRTWRVPLLLPLTTPARYCHYHCPHATTHSPRFPSFRYFLQVWYLRECPKTFVAKLASEMEQRLYGPGEFVDTPKTLAFNKRGLVTRKGKIIRKGGVWGIEFILDNPALIDRAPALCLSYVELAFLRRSKVDAALAADADEIVTKQMRRAGAWVVPGGCCLALPPFTPSSPPPSSAVGDPQAGADPEGIRGGRRLGGDPLWRCRHPEGVADVPGPGQLVGGARARKGPGPPARGGTRRARPGSSREAAPHAGDPHVGAAGRGRQSEPRAGGGPGRAGGAHQGVEDADPATDPVPAPHQLPADRWEHFRPRGRSEGGRDRGWPRSAAGAVSQKGAVPESGGQQQRDHDVRQVGPFRGFLIVVVFWFW
jgi:hypothetical protein